MKRYGTLDAVLAAGLSVLRVDAVDVEANVEAAGGQVAPRRANFIEDAISDRPEYRLMATMTPLFQFNRTCT